MAGGGLILAYHRIAAHPTDRFDLCTPPERFRAQMAALRQHGHPMPLDELAQAAPGGQLPAGAAAVTIDDGTLDGLTAAAILADEQVPATFFVNSGRLTERHESWWDILSHLIVGAQPAPPMLTFGSRRFATATAAERAATLELLHAEALRMTKPDRDALVAAVEQWSGADPSPRDSHRVLTGDELQRLAAAPGVTIGAHGADHLWLPAQPAEPRRREIADSKDTLERCLGRSVRAFSYPYGAHDDQVVEEVRAAGFCVAVTVEPRAVRRGDDRLRLPRLQPPPLVGTELAGWLRAAAT